MPESKKALRKVERPCGKQKAVDKNWKAVEETKKAVEENRVFYYIPNLSCYIYGTRRHCQQHRRLLNHLDVPANKGFATDEVSFISLFILVT